MGAAALTEGQGQKGGDKKAGAGTEGFPGKAKKSSGSARGSSTGKRAYKTIFTAATKKGRGTKEGRGLKGPNKTSGGGVRLQQRGGSRGREIRQDTMNVKRRKTTYTVVRRAEEKPLEKIRRKGIYERRLITLNDMTRWGCANYGGGQDVEKVERSLRGKS